MSLYDKSGPQDKDNDIPARSVHDFSDALTQEALHQRAPLVRAYLKRHFGDNAEVIIKGLGEARMVTHFYTAASKELPYEAADKPLAETAAHLKVLVDAVGAENAAEAIRTKGFDAAIQAPERLWDERGTSVSHGPGQRG